MNLPFTLKEFLEVFRNYNQDVFPMQIVLYLLTAVAVFFAFKKSRYSDKMILAIVAFLWLWMGVVYHLSYFTSINKAAWVFGSLFILEGGLFFYMALSKNTLSFNVKKDKFGIMGAIFIVFSLVVYPILSYFNGHQYPEAPTFGLPCPTTIFTLGLLLWTKNAFRTFLFIIPLLWSLIGFTAALSLEMYEDISLLLAGAISFILLLIKRKNSLNKSLADHN